MTAIGLPDQDELAVALDAKQKATKLRNLLYA